MEQQSAIDSLFEDGIYIATLSQLLELTANASKQINKGKMLQRGATNRLSNIPAADRIKHNHIT